MFSLKTARWCWEIAQGLWVPILLLYVSLGTDENKFIFFYPIWWQKLLIRRVKLKNISLRINYKKLGIIIMLVCIKFKFVVRLYPYLWFCWIWIVSDLEIGYAFWLLKVFIYILNDVNKEFLVKSMEEFILFGWPFCVI